MRALQHDNPPRGSAPTPEAGAAAPTSWRDIIKVHPAADLFPMMSAGGQKTLSEDIARNGVHAPLTFLTTGDKARIGKPLAGENLIGWARRKGFDLFLLDGRNRLAAIELIADPETRSRWLAAVFDTRSACAPILLSSFERDDPIAYVSSLNLHRRHLSADQRREIAAELLKATPDRSDRSVGKIAHLDNKTVAAVRADLEQREEIPHVEVRTDSAGRTQPADKRPVRKSEPSVQPVGTLTPIEEPPALHVEIQTAVADENPGGGATETAIPASPPSPTPPRRRPAAAPAAKRATRPSSSPAQQRDKAIVGFSTLLHAKLPDTLDDLTRLLRNERGRIVALPREKRLRLAVAYLDVFGISADDLKSEV